MINQNIKDFINRKYNNPKHLAGARILELLKIGWIINQCKKDLQKTIQWKTQKNILLGYFYSIPELVKCKICNKQLSVERTILAYKKKLNIDYLFCSRKCQGVMSQQNKQKILEKSKKTCLQKYGVDNASKSLQIKNKIKQASLQKYGVQNPFQAQQIKAKIKQTNLNRYGVECPQVLDWVKDKVQNTNLLRYGVKAPLQNKDILEKSKQTCLQKYGVQFSMQNQQILNKSQQTCLQKYGVPYSTLNSNRINAVLNKSWNTICGWKQYVIPMFSRQQYEGYTDKIYKWKCVKCGNQFQQKIYGTFCKNTIDTDIQGYTRIPRCLNCNPFSTASISRGQKKLLQFCRQYFPNLQQNNRQLIKPYQLDIVIPQIKLAIEFNGIYWHDINHVQSSYHLMKTQMCQKLGYRLIHIWQDQWYNDEQLIKNKLISIFQNRQVINLNQLLDRCWYSNIDIEGYSRQIIQSNIIQRNGYQCQNCGYIKYTYLNKN